MKLPERARLIWFVPARYDARAKKRDRPVPLSVLSLLSPMAIGGVPTAALPRNGIPLARWRVRALVRERTVGRIIYSCPFEIRL